jgi:hypothetical protein
VQALVVQVNDVCGDRVEELAVVGHHNQSLLPPAGRAGRVTGKAVRQAGRQ